MHTVIIEDHILYRDVLAKVCTEKGHAVMAAVTQATNGIAACRKFRPGLVILDMRLPGIPGGAVLDALAAEKPTPRVLVVSACLAEYLVHRIEEWRAPIGFIDKESATVRSVAEALDGVAAGRNWFSKAFLDYRKELGESGSPLKCFVTAREAEFLKYVAVDATDTEIAVAMQISLRTAQGYRSTIIQKLGVANSIQLAAFARKQGLDLFPPAALYNRL